MKLIPDAYYLTPKGNLVKYSFAMLNRNKSPVSNYLFWDVQKNCTVVFSEFEIKGLRLDQAAGLLYD